jgi:ketosteroid isomerase-like protein
MNHNLVAAVLLTGMSSVAFGQQSVSTPDRKAVETVVANYVAAFNRHDVAAAVADAAEDMVRVTPAGILYGRDEVRKNVEAVMNAGYHDVAIKVIDVKPSDNGGWWTTEWNAKVGDQETGGYASVVYARALDGSIKIINESYNIRLPSVQKAAVKN